MSITYASICRRFEPFFTCEDQFMQIISLIEIDTRSVKLMWGNVELVDVPKVEFLLFFGIFLFGKTQCYPNRQRFCRKCSCMIEKKVEFILIHILIIKLKWRESYGDQMRGLDFLKVKYYADAKTSGLGLITAWKKIWLSESIKSLGNRKSSTQFSALVRIAHYFFGAGRYISIILYAWHIRKRSWKAHQRSCQWLIQWQVSFKVWRSTSDAVIEVVYALYPGV